MHPGSVRRNIAKLDEIARKDKSENSLPAAMLAGLIATDSNPDWARQMLEWSWDLLPQLAGCAGLVLTVDEISADNLPYSGAAGVGLL